MKTTKLGNTLYEADPHAPVAEHTPTPWTFLDSDPESHLHVLIVKDQYGALTSGDIVAHVKAPRNSKNPKDEANANAAFMLRAVNAYDRDQQTIRELTDALGDACFEFEKWFSAMDEQEIEDSFGGMREALKKGHAALAKAKGALV